MLFQIVSYLLDVVAGLLGGAALLRLYMQMQRVPFGNPVGRVVFALTDWMVLPLRKVLRYVGRFDVSSLVAAYLVQLLKVLLLALLFGVRTPAALAGYGMGGLAWLPWMALVGVMIVAIQCLMGLLLVHVVLSWVQSRSPVVDVIDRLAAPVLRPVRRVLPSVGGVDFSPLVLLVLLQVLLMVLYRFL